MLDKDRVFVAKRPSRNVSLEMGYAAMRYALLTLPLFLSKESMQDDLRVRQFVESAFCHKFSRFYTVLSLSESKARIDYRSRQFPFFEKYHSDFVFFKDAIQKECFVTILHSDIISKNDSYHINDAPFVINKKALESFYKHDKIFITGVIKRKNSQRSQYYCINHYGYLEEIRKYASFAHAKMKELGTSDKFRDYLRNPEVQQNLSSFIEDNSPVENLVSIFYSPLLYLTSAIEDINCLHRINTIDSNHLKTKTFLFPNGILYEPQKENDIIDFFNLEL